MLYFVFTIDGDWKEYFNTRLSEGQRKPNKKELLSLIRQEIELASNVLDGKFIHFIHTSPLVKDDFLQPEYVFKWKEIEKKGGNIGVHCHEEDLHRAYYFDDLERMEKAIGDLTDGLSERGLSPIAYRGGYLTFSPKIIPILEENGIFLDFSCEPGKYLKDGDLLVSDWRGAPDNFYRLSYSDHRKPGNSRVFEIPLGIHLERCSLWEIWRKIKEFKRQKDNVVVSVLTHSYEFTSFIKRMRIRLVLLILRKYGRFIGGQEALEIIGKRSA